MGKTHTVYRPGMKLRKMKCFVLCAFFLVAVAAHPKKVISKVDSAHSPTADANIRLDVAGPKKSDEKNTEELHKLDRPGGKGEVDNKLKVDQLDRRRRIGKANLDSKLKMDLLDRRRPRRRRGRKRRRGKANLDSTLKMDLLDHHHRPRRRHGRKRRRGKANLDSTLKMDLLDRRRPRRKRGRKRRRGKANLDNTL